MSEAEEEAKLSGAYCAGFALLRLWRDAQGCVERRERGRPWPWILCVFGFIEKSGLLLFNLHHLGDHLCRTLLFGHP